MRSMAIRTCLCTAFLALPALASEVKLGDFQSNLVPKPVPYAVLLPDGYKDGPPLPLLLYLHGGGGDRTSINRLQATFD